MFIISTTLFLDMKKPGSRDIIESADMDVDDETTDYTIHTGEIFVISIVIIAFRRHESITESKFYWCHRQYAVDEYCWWWSFSDTQN